MCLQGSFHILAKEALVDVGSYFAAFLADMEDDCIVVEEREGALPNSHSLQSDMKAECVVDEERESA